MSESSLQAEISLRSGEGGGVEEVASIPGALGAGLCLLHRLGLPGGTGFSPPQFSGSSWCPGISPRTLFVTL